MVENAQKEHKRQQRVGPKSIGTLIGLSLATILGWLFWRRRRSF